MDTHVWLWMLAAPERLNDSARAAIANPENEAVLSGSSGNVGDLCRFPSERDDRTNDQLVFAQFSTDS